MVDYLQLMNASGARFGSRQEEVSTISRSLKGLAKEPGYTCASPFPGSTVLLKGVKALRASARS